jgi:hypothetical protein
LSEMYLVWLNEKDDSLKKIASILFSPYLCSNYITKMRI